MNQRPSREGLAAWRAFLEAHHAVTTVLGEELDQIGLPLTFYDVLVHLVEAGSEGLRMAGLAKRILLSKSGLTRLVDRMVKQGLVRRRQSPEDRRGYYVVATPAGQRALRRASPDHLRGIANHFTSLMTADELAVVAGAMRRVAEAAAGEPASKRSDASEPDDLRAPPSR